MEKMGMRKMGLKNMRMRKTMVSLLAIVIFASMLTGCMTKKGPDDSTDKERVLRIASSYGFDENYFRQQYTELFEFANDNIKIEVVPTNDNNRFGGYSATEDGKGQKPKDPFDKLTELMEGANPPDVVVVGFEQLNTLISKNLLAPLDPYIKKNKFDTAGIVPVVMDSLKNASSDGKLYALTPTFNSSALIYNKKMFTDAGVDFPKDHMTWDETFDLAKRLSKGEGKERKYGFSFSSQSQGDLYYSIQPYIAPLQLRMFDEQGEKMTVDNDKWEKTLTKMMQLQKDQIIPPSQSPEDMKNRAMNAAGDSATFNPFSYDDFMSGRVAMTIMNYGQLSQIINANKNAENFKGYTKIDWDVVTIPSHPEAPDVVAYVGFNQVMAINAKSANAADAWKFIEFTNSEKWAKFKSQSDYQMVSRKNYIKPKEGVEFHVEAFYNIKAVSNAEDMKLYRSKPSIYMVNEIGRQLMQQVFQGKMGVKDALKEWQTKGDDMLQKIKENPTATPNPAMFQNAVPASKG